MNRPLKGSPNKALIAMHEHATDDGRKMIEDELYARIEDADTARRQAEWKLNEAREALKKIVP